VRGVDHQGVGAGGGQLFGARDDVAVDPDGGRDAQTSVGIDGGAGPTLNIGSISLLGSTALTIGNTSTTAGSNLTVVLNGAYAGNTGGRAARNSRRTPCSSSTGRT
jgi:hypothetical protein